MIFTVQRVYLRKVSLVTLVPWLVVTSMGRQIHKRLTLQLVLLDRTAPEHGETSQNKQERKSSISTQETTCILELMVDWVQNKHRCKESSSTLRYQWKGKEKEKKQKTNKKNVFLSLQSLKRSQHSLVRTLAQKSISKAMLLLRKEDLLLH